jgi:5'-nucleotidase
MNILLTNDDGIHCEGLWALYRQFRPHHTVTVIAPDRERSAIGHAITLSDPLRATMVTVNGGYRGYAVSGTPADCVKLGLFELLRTRPDIVIAGINPGANVGININYSGTVAAAKEAAIYGVAAVAVSLDGAAADHFEDAARFVRRLTEKVHCTGLPAGTFLNVNIPGLALAAAAGVRLSRQGLPAAADVFDKRVDPRNRTYYWQGRETQRFEASPDIDGTALSEKFISITPIKCDMTDYRVLDQLRRWKIGI